MAQSLMLLATVICLLLEVAVADYPLESKPDPAKVTGAAIAGIVIGSLGFCLLIFVGYMLFIRKRSRQ